MHDKKKYHADRSELKKLRETAQLKDDNGVFTKEAVKAQVELTSRKEAAKNAAVVKSYSPNEYGNLHAAKRARFGGGPRQVRRRMDLDQRRQSA